MSYYGRPILKPPPWTWEVPLYLFVGGLAGSSAVIAFAAAVGRADAAVVRAALWLAAGGAALSALLLVSDLGRPTRFLNMLRVFKWRSPMSVGAWLLTAFGGAAALALGLVGYSGGSPGAVGGGVASVGGGAFGWAALVAAALAGSLVATYTGVLLSVTVVPAWRAHAGLLPLHFGVAALGSAAAALELIGYRLDALHLLGLFAAATETALALWLELRPAGVADRALRVGASGSVVRASGALVGPLALMLRLVGWRGVAASTFLLGALLGRFAWIASGRASTRDPEAAR
jgi:formate-dependent nitrite reductase membrane component NrfD